jgi:protein SCO1/2
MHFNFARLQKRFLFYWSRLVNLGADADRFQVILFTMDPERDTPSQLKSYVSVFDPTFLGVSTDLKQTRLVADEFHVYYKKVPTATSYTMEHTALSYLFDQKGKLRLAVRYDFSPNQVTQDVRKLLSAQPGHRLPSLAESRLLASPV